MGVYAFQTKIDDVVKAMLTKVTPKHNNNVFKQQLKQIAQGYVRELQTAAKSVTITGTILGGAAPAGGPVVGATLTCTPGSLVSKAPDAETGIALGRITMRVGSRTLVGNTNTEHMRAVRKLLAKHVRMSWTAWCSQWMCSALPVAQGGIAAWVPSTPPAPGPWTLGTITPFTLAPLAGLGGLSTDPTLAMLPETVVTAARATPWTFTMPEGDKLRIMLVNKDGVTSEMETRAYAYGWQWLMQDFTQNVMVQDATGCAASGVVAPLGVVTSGVISGLSLLVS